MEGLVGAAPLSGWHTQIPTTSRIHPVYTKCSAQMLSDTTMNLARVSSTSSSKPMLVVQLLFMDPC